MAKITASENPAFTEEMEAMERTTPAHYKEFNDRYQQLLDNDKFLREPGLIVSGGMVCQEFEQED